MPSRQVYVPNQVFVGLPWRNVRPRYERIIEKLEGKYPIYFKIVGRNDKQDAEDLFEVIKTSIDTSSKAIFDATGGNANVSLEFGYAESKDIPRCIFLSVHRSVTKDQEQPILADLSGQRRVQYTAVCTARLRGGVELALRRVDRCMADPQLRMPNLRSDPGPE